jgi:hypothetical protein
MMRALVFGLVLTMTSCQEDVEPPPQRVEALSEIEPAGEISLPREWTPISRATPDMPGQFGPHDWQGCSAERRCTATTWSPIKVAPSEGIRPTLTLLRVGKKSWRTDAGKQRWRTRWSWIDPVLSACLGSSLDGSVAGAGVDRRLVEHDDGFWWTHDLDGVGPCDLRGGLELAATQDTGRLTKLTASGHTWGSPAAAGWAVDALAAEQGGAQR